MSKSQERQDLPPLKARMQDLGFKTYRQLSHYSGLSMKQLRKVRNGQASELRLQVLVQLAQTLQISLVELLTLVGVGTAGQTAIALHPSATSTVNLDDAIMALQAEYQRLQAECQALVQQTQITCQREALQVLEPWLQYWPVAAKAAQENPTFQATTLLPLCKPVETLLNQWQVDAIAAIGSEVPYDPQLHQLIDGAAEPGTIVRVRYPGYLHQGKLHFRAKVSPL